MNTKLSRCLSVKHTYFLCGFVSILFLAGGCGKKDHEKLAQTYYKLSCVELSEPPTSEVAYKKALDYAEKACELDDRIEYRVLCASLLFKLNHFDQSLELFRDVLKKNPPTRIRAEVRNNIACIYAQQGKGDKAEHIWKKLVNASHYLTPEVALVNLGKLYGGRGNVAKAQECFSRAVTLAPNYIDAHFYSALCAYQAGDVTLVRQEVSTILFMEPKHPGAQHLAGLVTKV